MGARDMDYPISIHPRATSRVASSVRTVTSNMVPTQKAIPEEGREEKKKKKKV